MANKKRSFFATILGLRNLLFVIPSLFTVAHQVFSLSIFESKKAMKSLVTIFILAFFIVALTTTTWLALLALFYIYLTSLLWTPLAAMSLVLLMNVIVLVIFILLVWEAKKNLSLPATRKQLQIVKKIYTD